MRCRIRRQAEHLCGHRTVIFNPLQRRMYSNSRCRRRRTATAMYSGGIQSMMEESDSDFLLLYDCCHAYNPANLSGVHVNGSHRNVIEVISAVGFGDIAAEPGEHSFTHHL